jgi:Leucine-rich repeat (LRR) protein
LPLKDVWGFSAAAVGGCFGQLEVLQLGFNKITDIGQLGLDRIPELKVLYLHGNEITRISGLHSCVCLRELVLDKNKIKAVEPGSFVGLSDLRELRLQENGLKSLANFGPLVNLQVLALGHNRIGFASALLCVVARFVQ